MRRCGAGGTLGSMFGTGVASIAGNFAGYGAQGLLGGKPTTDFQHEALSFGVGTVTYGMGGRITSAVGLSEVNLPEGFDMKDRDQV